jgi:hypothetical protein
MGHYRGVSDREAKRERLERVAAEMRERNKRVIRIRETLRARVNHLYHPARGTVERYVAARQAVVRWFYPEAEYPREALRNVLINRKGLMEAGHVEGEYEWER